jgi:GGDEF domain-containing protein
MERTGRLTENFSEVLRASASEALALLPAATDDADVRDAVLAMLERARETARSLRLRAVSEAADAALVAVRDDAGAAAASVEALLEACRGLDGAAALLRPVIVVCSTGGVRLRRAPDGLSVGVEHVTSPADALRRARTEGPAALVLSVEALEQLGSELPSGVPVYACVPEDDLDRRLRASALGALRVFPTPLDLRAMLPHVRAQQCAGTSSGSRGGTAGRAHERDEPLRIVLAHPSPGRASLLARALRAGTEPGELELVTLSDPSSFLDTVAAVAPDLVLLGDGPEEPDSPAPLGEDELFGGALRAATPEAWPGAEALAAVLDGHPRFTEIPRARVDAAFGVLAAPLPSDPDDMRAEVHRRLREARRLACTRTVDVATGTLAPVALLTAADREIAAARRSRVPLAAVRVDLDAPAALRARKGPSGLRVALAQVADALRTGLRETDLIGRVSVTGLLVLLPGCAAEDARGRFEEQLDALEPVVGRLRLGVADTLGGFEDVLVRADRDRLRGPERA